MTAVMQANVPKLTGHIFLLRDLINLPLCSMEWQDSQFGSGHMNSQNVLFVTWIRLNE
jgi:hypothetical protein